MNDFTVIIKIYVFNLILSIKSFFIFKLIQRSIDVFLLCLLNMYFMVYGLIFKLVIADLKTYPKFITISYVPSKVVSMKRSLKPHLYVNLR